MSGLFRAEIKDNADIQAVLAEYRPKLIKYYKEACLATSAKVSRSNSATSLPPQHAHSPLPSRIT